MCHVPRATVAADLPACGHGEKHTDQEIYATGSGVAADLPICGLVEKHSSEGM
jgi:hypothetical protein